MDVLARELSKAPSYDSSGRLKRKLTDEIKRWLEEYMDINAKKRSSGRSKLGSRGN